jgi:hypothetical protein
MLNNSCATPSRLEIQSGSSIYNVWRVFGYLVVLVYHQKPSRGIGLKVKNVIFTTCSKRHILGYTSMRKWVKATILGIDIKPHSCGMGEAQSFVYKKVFKSVTDTPKGPIFRTFPGVPLRIYWNATSPSHPKLSYHFHMHRYTPDASLTLGLDTNTLLLQELHTFTCTKKRVSCRNKCQSAGYREPPYPKKKSKLNGFMGVGGWLRCHKIMDIKKKHGKASIHSYLLATSKWKVVQSKACNLSMWRQIVSHVRTLVVQYGTRTHTLYSMYTCTHIYMYKCTYLYIDITYMCTTCTYCTFW